MLTNRISLDTRELTAVFNGLMLLADHNESARPSARALYELDDALNPAQLRDLGQRLETGVDA